VLVGKKIISQDNCVCRTTVTTKAAEDPESLKQLVPEISAIDPSLEKKSHRDQFAIEQEQREREEGWRDNPSVDPETQMAIMIEYRALHEQFKSEGLYKPRYDAYAWECLRYAALFAAFGYFLYAKWYMTSAVFLGLFWVCILPHSWPLRQVANLHSNKSCSQPTTPATAA